MAIVGLVTFVLACIGLARVVRLTLQASRRMLARLGRTLATLDGATVIASVPPHAARIGGRK